MRRDVATKAVRMLAAIGLVAGIVATNVAPAAAATKWTVVPSVSPKGPPDGNLAGVSCATPTDCFAVGDDGSGTLIEHWDGSSWRFVASANPKGEVEPFLSAVTCTSTTSCFAVGSAGTLGPSGSGVTLVERWDGTKWSVVPSPTPSGGDDVSLSAVACSSATDCFAVGGTANFSLASDAVTGAPVTEHWDGTTWTIVAVPTPTSTVDAELNGVACPGPNNCFAVGDYQARATGGALMEHWNGASWSIVANPDSTGATHAITSPRLDLGFGSSPSLFSISCPTGSSCTAVGESFSGSALIERWDGTTWTIVDSPTPRNAVGVQLLGVSCVATNDCSAVGTADIETSSGNGTIITGAGAPVAEHWNGTVWAIAPEPSGGGFRELSAVSCASTTYCAAVGDSAVAQQWNGTSWSIAAFAEKTSQSHLDQVACPSAKSCFAVGSFDSGTSGNTLVEHWNGSAWSVLPSPKPKGASEVELIGVSCPSTASCFAVGYYATSSAEQMLIEHWNGKAWSVMTSPVVKNAEIAELTSVSCASTTDCNAVGISLALSATSLIVHWNGAKWSVVPSPSAGTGSLVELRGVSCTSATDCTAVGGLANLSSNSPNVKPAAEHFDGTKWSVVPAAAPSGAPLAILTTVSCSSANSCVAVGIDAKSDLGSNATLAERWDGTAWTIVPTPAVKGSLDTELVGVSCRSAQSCVAVGGYTTASGGKTLVEQWNGKSVTVVPSPSPAGGSDTALTGVACPTSASCVAVGAYSSRFGSFTLTERGS